MRIIEENKRLAAAGPSTHGMSVVDFSAMEASEHWISMPAEAKREADKEERKEYFKYDP